MVDATPFDIKGRVPEEDSTAETIHSTGIEIYGKTLSVLCKNGVEMGWKKKKGIEPVDFYLADGNTFYLISVDREWLQDERDACRIDPAECPDPPEPINVFGEINIFILAPKPLDPVTLPQKLIKVNRSIAFTHEEMGRSIFSPNKELIELRRWDFRNGEYKVDAGDSIQDYGDYIFTKGHLEAVSSLLSKSLES